MTYCWWIINYDRWCSMMTTRACGSRCFRLLFWQKNPAPRWTWEELINRSRFQWRNPCHSTLNTFEWGYCLCQAQANDASFREQQKNKNKNEIRFLFAFSCTIFRKVFRKVFLFSSFFIFSSFLWFSFLISVCRMTAEPMAKPLPMAAVVLPAASRASVRRRTWKRNKVLKSSKKTWKVLKIKIEMKIKMKIKIKIEMKIDELLKFKKLEHRWTGWSEMFTRTALYCPSSRKASSRDKKTNVHLI